MMKITLTLLASTLFQLSLAAAAPNNPTLNNRYCDDSLHICFAYPANWYYVHDADSQTLRFKPTSWKSCPGVVDSYSLLSVKFAKGNFEKVSQDVGFSLNQSQQWELSGYGNGSEKVNYYQHNNIRRLWGTNVCQVTCSDDGANHTSECFVSTISNGDVTGEFQADSCGIDKPDFMLLKQIVESVKFRGRKG